MFIELQPGVFNRTLSVYNSVFDYQAIYEDYNSSTSEWYSEPYKPVSFSLTGKTGLQYILNDKYSLNFAVYYCNYLTSFIKSSFLGPGNVYYRYGIETGVKLKLN
jgi:hypothetical protein